MCFGFGESATTGRDKYYYREEIYPTRPVSYRDRDRDRYRDGYHRSRDWDRYSVSNNPSRSSYHSYHHHHHHSDHHHHDHDHHDHRNHNEYRRGERNNYSYYPSARSSVVTTNGTGSGYGVYGNSYIPVTGTGAGRLLRDSPAATGTVPIVTTMMNTSGTGRRGSVVSERLLPLAEGQGPVVYERTTDSKRYI